MWVLYRRKVEWSQKIWSVTFLVVPTKDKYDEWCYINMFNKIDSFQLFNMVFGSLDYDCTFFLKMGSIMLTCTKKIIIIVE
jgi:hypothetical protein